MDNGVADIVAAGRLKLGLFPSFMYTRSSSGAIVGIAVELAGMLAQRLGVAVEYAEFRAPPQLVQALREGSCDVGLLGIDPGRAGEVDFTAPLMRADFTYLVPAGSDIATIPDADAIGTRIAVVRNHAMEFALKGKIARAQTVYVDVPDAAFELLRGGEVEVAAGIRPGLIAYAERLPGSRVLADRYGANTLALAVAKGRAERLAWFDGFVGEARATGLARQAIERAGLAGIDVP